MKALNLFSQRSLHLICLLPFLCHEVAANTEIINFSSTREPTVDLPLDVVGNWSRLDPTDNERHWSLEPASLRSPLHQVCEQTDEHAPFSCPHELWLLLDLDDEKWASYTSFTLRLSWPASTPADFAIALYSSQDIRARLSERGFLSSSTPEGATSSSTPHPPARSRYARIRAVDASVPTPSSQSHRYPIPLAPLPRHTGSDTPVRVVVEEEKGAVPFVLILEPAYMGVLPATLLPTIGLLVPIVLATVSLVPWVTAYFEPLVQQAREDLKTRTNKDR